jgi:hypothetical protein
LKHKLCVSVSLNEVSEARCSRGQHSTGGECGAWANAMRRRTQKLRLKLSFETRKSERMVHSEDGHEDSGKTNTAQAAAASTGHAALSTPATW